MSKKEEKECCASNCPYLLAEGTKEVATCAIDGHLVVLNKNGNYTSKEDCPVVEL